VLNYIASLAVEGETALVVKQKDNTWPAYLPEKWRGEASWYCNTGSFIVSRFVDGRVSASASNCTHCLAMMLDDIGTKSKLPPLPPTWIMETSPGNYQYGYAFNEQPTVGEFSTAIKAIAAAGYTDPGACNPVRNFRLPGSINQKNGFASVLTEFTPGREYSVGDICAALGVVPGVADTATMRPVGLADDGDDDVLAWIAERGDLLENANGEGWCGVVCPNSSEHTDGNPMGRYRPVSRAYTCFHGHCVDDWNSARYLTWVAEQGGPDHQHGLRDELLATVMAGALGKISPTTAFPDETVEIIREVNRKEMGRLEKAEWYERFAYIMSDDAYFDMMERREIMRKSFNAVFAHIPCKSIHGTAKVAASVCYDENRQAKGARTLQGVTYAAGESVLATMDGAVFGNRWRDARPPTTEGDASRWLEHVERLIPEQFEREHVLDVLAYKLQHADKKINHAVLHGGLPGSGKDTLYAPFLWAIGRSNVSIVKNEELSSSWGYALEAEVMVINELRQAEARDRRAMENVLKPIIAAPPEYLPVNREGLHPYNALNRIWVLCFSNERAAISIPSNDRRWFCVWSDAPRMTDAEGAAMWAWYERGGNAIVAGYLASRDVSAFLPGASPPMTEAKAIMVERGRSAHEEYLQLQIEARIGVFSLGVIAGPWHAICDALTQPGQHRIHPSALMHALNEAGWSDAGRLMSKANTTKKQVFVSAEMAARYTKSQLRDMVEAPLEVGLRVVKNPPAAG
jgi:hypothetical protein